MKDGINKYLEQLSEVIQGLKQENPKPEKLADLEQLLELLIQKIKTAKLGQTDTDIIENRSIRQDASFYFDTNYNIVRYTGFFKNIFGRRNEQFIPGIEEFLDENSFNTLREKTGVLLKTGELQEFKVKVVSVNQILFPAIVMLEKITFGSGRELISAGLTFTGQNPEDLKDYQEILIENLPDMDVCLFDTELRHVLAGGKEKKRFELTNAKFTGKTFYEVYSEKIQKRLYPFYRNALDGNVSEGEIRVADQTYFISSTPVRNINNEVAGGALIAQNVTKEKEVEQKLRQSKKEAEDADKTKSLFLARMSHEMRTPLNAIIGFNGLLNKTDLTPRQKEFSHLIGQSAEHLLSVVNEILFLFKLGMGKVYIENIAFNMYELMGDVHESMLLQAKNKNLRLNVTVEEEVPEIMVGDPFRVKQILMNLVSNAIKFTEEGSVSVKIKADKIRKQKVQLRFEVRDTGIGISAKELDKIYDEFSQSDFKTDKSRKGAGLGLTICKKLVGLLNGQMSVESELHKGSVFTVIIPFKRSKSKELVLKDKKYNVDFNQLEGKKILYADDDENNVLLDDNILSGWKSDYRIATDGKQALEMLNKEKFDVALLDIHMPELSGLEVLRKIKRNNSGINYKTKA
ncbi:MAG: ATP-binding protein, partial [Prolixibacteraceae bacterium]